MPDGPPWRPVLAVAWDALQSLALGLPPVRWLGSASRLRAAPRSQAGVPVFVMLPLDAGLAEPRMGREQLQAALHGLKGAGAAGVMADVWWGVCEPGPGTYDFSGYVGLFRACRDAGLAVQATMSFHACGGNVGDSVNIPLPGWVVAAGDAHGLWFTDREGGVTKEYITFGADHERVLPGVEVGAGVDEYGEPVRAGEGGGGGGGGGTGDGQGRTPVEAYGAFVGAFAEAMRAEGLLGTTITEVQVGLGPCGELRYPSYQLGRWEFPGIGEMQCFDKYLLADLAATVREKGSERVRAAQMPPDGTGRYNDRPCDAKFWRGGFRCEAGRFFLQWYSGRLLRHGDDVLGRARAALGAADGVAVAVKVAGVHWWRFRAGRPAEAAAGYAAGAYAGAARLARAHGAVLDFTCLEMRTVDQPFVRARCGPRQLVAEVFRAAAREGVAVAGENALERFDAQGLGQVVLAFRRCPARAASFTLLRLGDALLEEQNMRNFERFVADMGKVC